MHLPKLMLSLLIALGIALIPGHTRAQSNATTDAASDLSTFGVRCTDGQCTIAVDMGPLETEIPVPRTAPLQFRAPEGSGGIFSDVSVDIADGLTLGLPTGDIHMDTGDITVGLDADGNIQRLQGTAAAVLPSLDLPNNLRIGGSFPAEFGYDVGANLGRISELLDPEQQYLYLRLGDGFSLDTTLTDADGTRTPVTLSVPDDETATLVIDPENQLLYLDGRFNISQVLRLALVGAALGVDVSQLPMLGGLAIPLESTVGVAALLSREPARNFVELSGDLAVEGGPLGSLLRIDDAPLVLDSAVRIDRSGIKLQGAVDAKLAPATLLESGGTVELFVPFERLRDAYVRLGGDLSVPILGLTAENDTTLQRAPEGDAAADSDGTEGGDGEAVTELPWWNDARNWIGAAAGRTADAVSGGAETGIGAVQNAVDAARGRLRGE